MLAEHRVEQAQLKRANALRLGRPGHAFNALTVARHPCRRALGLLDGLGAELSAGEWRLAAVPGVDQRRARAALRDDLDVL